MDTRTVDYFELIGNGKSYRVPPHQRDYSWQEEQWEDLWEDIASLRQSATARHYMGAVLVQAVEDRSFRVIDGQQRLATLSLLTLAVVARLGALADNGIDAQANVERARQLRYQFVGIKDPAALTESSRLYLNDTDDGFYQYDLVQLREPRNRRGLPRSNGLLWDCFQYFLGRIAADQTLGDDGLRLASFLSETIARQLSFTLIVVDDELQAFAVFETLNARGVALTATDLLKNHLFSLVKAAGELAWLRHRWQSLIERVGQRAFPTFLRHHMLCEHPKIRPHRLFHLLRSQVRTQHEVLDLIHALDGRAELFAAVRDPSHEYWIDLPAARPHLRDLNLFEAGDCMPLLFTTWERFSRRDFVRIVKLTTTIAFRYSVVGNLNTNALAPVYHRAAKAVADGRARSPAAVFEILKPVYLDDDGTRERFALLAVPTAGPRKRLVKCVLAALEQDASGRACDPERDPATIEHVLPENPSDEWGESFDQTQWRRFVYRLGNYALLEAGANRRVANLGYAAKLAAYQDSVYATTLQIPQLAPEEWTPALVDERQRRMAERAVHLWRADYP